MHDPSFSQSRPRLGCLAGTLRPSRRQIRSTRLSLTIQPASRSRAAILRLSAIAGNRLSPKGIPVATVPTGQLDEVGRELLFVVTAPRHLTLCRTVLPEGATHTPLGQLRHRHDVVDTSAPAGGAQ